MPVPLSPAAEALLRVLKTHRRAHTLAELRSAIEGAGHPGSMVISALAECILRRLVRKVPTWPGAETHYELEPSGADR